MAPSAWVMLALLAAMFVVLFVTDIPPAAVFSGVLTICLTFHLGPVAGLLSGFTNSSVLTVAVVFVVAAGMYSTRAINRVVDQLIGVPRRNMVRQYIRNCDIPPSANAFRFTGL